MTELQSQRISRNKENFSTLIASPEKLQKCRVRVLACRFNNDNNTYLLIDCYYEKQTPKSHISTIFVEHLKIKIGLFVQQIHEIKLFVILTLPKRHCDVNLGLQVLVCK